MGNYYSALQNQTNAVGTQNNSGSRIGQKRLNNNFLENLEKSNYVSNSNYNQLDPTKKRNS
jgi:hypothetical protein